jgi:drug/metabolite transporter (DMT)-like permease
MKFSSKSVGLATMILSSVSFATSGAFIKPLLESGWSPAAAVTVRALTGGLILLPLVLFLLRGRWGALWRARWRVLGMGAIAVAFTQLAYFAAIQRIPVATALLIEYQAPLLLVAFVWVTSRRMPKPAVLIGSVLAIGGLVLVIGPGALQAVDLMGVLFALAAAVGCAIYFVVAARPADGLPPVALAGAGLLLGGVLLGLAGAVGVVPFSVAFESVTLFGNVTPWWLPLLVVALVGTALAYAAGIAGSGLIGSRLASFVGLLEVVFASVLAWFLLGEQLSALQMVGGLLILAGIAVIPGEQTPAAVALDEEHAAGEVEAVPAKTGEPASA